MALTLPRWIAIFLIGGLLLVPLAFRERVSEEPPSPAQAATFSLFEASDRASRTASNLAERVWLFRLRDSLAHVSSTATPIAPGMAVTVDGTFDSRFRPAFQALVARSGKLAAPQTIVTPTVVAFILDSVQSVRGVTRPKNYGPVALTYILPTTAGAPCTVVARVNPSTLFGPRDESSSPRSAGLATKIPDPFDPEWLHDEALESRLLGPCAFYAAFGPPGAGIQPWLRSGGWTLAAVNTWGQSSAGAWTIRDRNAEFNAMQLTYSSYQILGQAINITTDARSFSDGEGALSMMAPRGVDCLAAMPGACVADLLNPGETRGIDSPGSNFISMRDFSFSNGDTDFGALLSFGQRQEQLFSDFITTQGQERFGRVWRSSRPLPDAFRVDGGIDLERATREWAQQGFGVLELGPAIHTAGLVSGGVGLFVGVLLTFAAARRRQVT